MCAGEQGETVYSDLIRSHTTTNDPGKNLAAVVSNYLEQPNPFSNISHHNTYYKAGRKGTVQTEAGKGLGGLMAPLRVPHQGSPGQEQWEEQ